MAKEFKGNPTRTPPEPTADHAGIEEWFRHLMPDLVPTVRGVDDTIRDVLPGVHYAVKYQRAFYGLPEVGWIIELAPYAVSVNVLFLAGADFVPPPPLGDTGRTRYVKIRSGDDTRSPQLVTWIEQAGRTPGW